MSKKLLSLIGGTLISGLLLVGCGVNDDEQNPPPEDIDIEENGDRVEDDHVDTDLDMDGNDETLDNDGTNGTDMNGGTNGTNGTNGTTGNGTNGTNGTNGNGMNGTTGNGTTGTNGDADVLDDDEDKK
jgi:hypothetical protein